MLQPRWHACKRTALLLCAIAIPVTEAQISGNLTSCALRAVQSTCPSRSINYITQTLPQQCLTTSWARKSTAQQTLNTTGGVQTPTGVFQSLSTSDSALPHSSPVVASHGQEISDLPATLTIEPITSDVSSDSPSAPQVTVTSSIAEPLFGGHQDTESDSPLDNADFLSFEEWKKQNLAKAGQSAEHLGARSGGGEPRRRPGGINNALDSLGEDTEIEIDFGGFVDPGNSAPGTPTGKASIIQDDSAGSEVVKKDGTEPDVQGARKRGKDAGKTCKERSNYASFDCAATVRKTNPESKGSTAMLVENKDSYMLNTCSAKNKFFIVELCDDILIDTVVLANFEFFSSMFRTFRVSVSDRYPVKLEKWKDLGTFEARNSREIQAFLIENPLIWARYLRLEFLTHFGNEYYCPVSLLRVHGTTMMEEFNHDLKRTGSDDDNEPDLGEGEGDDSVESTSGVVSADALKTQTQETSEKINPPASTPVDVPTDTTTVNKTQLSDSQPSPNSTSHKSLNSGQLEEVMSALTNYTKICRPEDRPANNEPESQTLHINQTTSSVQGAVATDSIAQHVPSTTKRMTMSNSTDAASVSSLVGQPAPEKGSSQNKSEPAKPANQTSASTAKIQTSSTQPPNANPTTQESFFKSVHKRLQLLESNSTLSLQYIEEQSRILRDAFSKVEKRQLAKTTSFLESLNTTVLTELRDFRMQYDQIWQSTVLELSSQREQSQHEVFALSARLSLLADEIVFQKRMAIIQFILILICLGLAIFARSGSSSGYLELPPLMQNALNKSPRNLSRYAELFDTPPVSPSATRPSSRYGLFRGLTHRSSPSNDSQLEGYQDGRKSPSIEYSPPTPTSQSSPEELHPNDCLANDSSDGSPQRERNSIRQTKSSPATPSGEREAQKDLLTTTL